MTAKHDIPPRLPVVPLGYYVAEHPWRSKLIARMWELDGRGISIRVICDRLSREFDMPISFSFVQRSLRRVKIAHPKIYSQSRPRRTRIGQTPK